MVSSYIYNESKRFYTFVANRVQEIQNHTKPVQRHYVASESNPADPAFRGLTACQLVQDSHWLKGPNFLWSSDDYSTHEPLKSPVLTVPNPEIKGASALVTQSVESFPGHFETSRLDRFSDWFRAKTTVALCLQGKNSLKRRIQRESLQGEENKYSESQISHCQGPMVEDLAHAEQEIIQSLQHEHFEDEIKVLHSLNAGAEFLERKAAKKRNTSLKKCSCLYRLDPYLKTKGILRVGGRLRRANLPDSFKHSVILPRRSHITELIIQDSHCATKHQG